MTAAPSVKNISLLFSLPYKVEFLFFTGTQPLRLNKGLIKLEIKKGSTTLLNQSYAVRGRDALEGRLIVDFSESDIQRIGLGTSSYKIFYEEDSASTLYFSGSINVSQPSQPEEVPQTQLTAAQIATFLSRSNHTGTQPASTISGLSLAATTGSYSDLLNRPSFSEVATTGSYNSLIDRPNFSAVATSGLYSSLLGLPSLGGSSSLDVGTTAVTVAPGNILDSHLSSSNPHPNLALVSRTGSYFDLLNTPVLGSASALSAPLGGNASAIQVVLGSDTRLTNAREWSAETVSRIIAEQGSSITRYAWTPLRIREATEAWWLLSPNSSKLITIQSGATANATNAQLRDRATHTGTQPASTVTGLSTVATTGLYSDLIGAPAGPTPTDWVDVTNKPAWITGSTAFGQAFIGLADAAAARTNLGLGGAAALNVGTTTGTVAAGNDNRFTDARTPLAHTHGNVTNVGAIGSTANLPVITGASGVLQTGTFGSTANTFCQGNDSRLSDARTPLAHTQAWSTITSTPTTLAGYGITDAASGTINNGTLTLAVSGVGLAGSATFTANQSGSSTFTVSSNATSANTASTIVARDGSGNFTAGTITATLTGNSSTTTTLQTSRTIGGVSFNGSANINLPGVNAAGNQDTTGSAATLTTSRNIWGRPFNGSADITGNLTSVGNITGTEAITILTGGTNQNITLTPSGTGTVNAPTFNATSTTAGGFQGIAADSVTNPSFTWTGDLDTGMYRIPSNTLGFTTGGNTAFRMGVNNNFSYRNLYISPFNELLADSVNTTRDSSELFWRGRYWDGSSSVNTNWNAVYVPTDTAGNGEWRLRNANSNRLVVNNSGTVTATTFAGALTGNATTATTLATGRTIAITGDLTWTSPSFNGSGNVTAAGTLANSGVSAGTYRSVTVNVKGLVTSGTNPTTLAGYGITDAAALTHTHGNITNAGAIGSTANLPIITTTAGVLTTGTFGTAANSFCQGNDARLSDARTPTAHNQVWSTITSTPTTLSAYGITDAQPLDSDLTSIAALTTTPFGRSFLDRADATAGRTLLALGTLATQSGTFSGTSSGTNTGDQTITLTGDVTGSGTGSFAATIAADSVTYAKIQNVSTTDRLLGRSAAGAGDVQEIVCTAAGRNLIDDADITAQRTTLGLGTLATQSGTFSGTSSGTNTGNQTITNTSDATSHTVTLSATGGSVQLVEGNNITLTTTGTGSEGIVTVASPGVPVGGVVDDALVKIDGTDYNTQWASRRAISRAGEASTPARLLSGTWFTGGTATTTKPQLLIEPTGTSSTSWSLNGTGLGVNAPSGFMGSLIDLQLNGSSKLSMTSSGSLLVGTTTEPTGSYAGSVVANNRIVIGSENAGISQQISGNLSSITATTGTIAFRFQFISGDVPRGAMVRLRVAHRANNNVPSNSAAAEYVFQLHATGPGVCTINGLTTDFEYTYVRDTHFTFTNHGSRECSVTLTNPTSFLLSGGYHIDILCSEGRLALTTVTVT